jgi:tetratricopeptide (TPR) repeat protein
MFPNSKQLLREMVNKARLQKGLTAVPPDKYLMRIHKNEHLPSLRKMEVESDYCEPLDLKTFQRDLHAAHRIVLSRLVAYIEHFEQVLGLNTVFRFMNVALQEGLLISQPEAETIFENISKLYFQHPHYSKFVPSRFIGRTKEIQRAITWAAGHQAILWVCGFGGNGKTIFQMFLAQSLRCGWDHLRSEFQKCEPYEATIWMADSEASPLDFDSFLNKITFVLDNPSHHLYLEGNQDQLPPSPTSQNRKSDPEDVRQLLQKRRALVVVDNAETIEPVELTKILGFFKLLPGESRSRLVIGARSEPKLSESEGITSILIKGLEPQEASQFVTDLCHSKMVSLSEDEIQAICVETECNPAALQIIVGLVSRGHELRDILGYLKRGIHREVVTDIYHRIIRFSFIKALSTPERLLLLAKGLFPFAERETVLADVAGVEREKGHDLFEKLQSLYLVNFEKLATKPGAPEKWMIDTHNLIQRFLETIWHGEDYGIEELKTLKPEIEKRWWSYAYNLNERVGQYNFEQIEQREGFPKKVGNVLGQISKRIERGELKALELFTCYEDGYGHIFLQWCEWHDVLRICKNAVPLALRSHKPKLLGYLLLDQMSTIHRERGDFKECWACIKEAEKYHSELYAVMSSIADPNACELFKAERDWFQADTKMVRGNIHRREGDYVAAIGAYQEAEKLFHQLGDVRKSLDVTINHGGCLLEQALENLRDQDGNPVPVDSQGIMSERLSLIKDLFHSAIKKANESGLDSTRWWKFSTGAACIAWLGVLARVNGDYSTAQQLLKESESGFHRQLSIARLYREQALVEHLLGNKKAARDLDMRGIQLLEKAQVFHSREFSHQNYHRVIESLKNSNKWCTD